MTDEGLGRRVLLTGGTGLIGAEVVGALAEAGFEVHAVTTKEGCCREGAHWICGSLFDDDFIRRTMAEVRPQYLLNLAWATTGDYLTNDVNYRFLHAGEVLSQAFAEAGGRRAVHVGTCFEYRFKASPLKETDELDPEKNAYTHCKNELRLRSERLFSSAGVSFAFGRIFYVFGRNEAKTRLTGKLVDSFSRGEPVTITAGPLRKDYLYTKDIAGALAALLASEVEGPVNICSGSAVTLRDYVLAFANAFGHPELARFEDAPGSQPPVIVGDNSRLLNEVGYVPRWPLAQAIEDLLGR